MSSDTEDQNTEFQQQVDTYVAWVNSQLKKRTTTSPVKSLRKDLSDGVLLVSLVEIISGEKIENVRLNARNNQDKLHNVNLILRFLTARNIRVHHVTDRDIIEGNTKSIMRLILTLAAHFKPSSVGSRNKSVAAAAANATAALSDMHKRVSSSPSYRRHKSSTPCERKGQSRFTPSNSCHMPIQFSQDDKGRTPPDGGSFISKTASSSDPFVSSSFSESQSGDFEETADLKNVPLAISKTMKVSESSRSDVTVEQFSECIDDLGDELASTKNLMSVLQKLLLQGEIPEENGAGASEQCFPLETFCINEESLIIQSQLDLCQHENDRLKDEIVDVRQECRSAMASKSALNSRVQHQDKELVALKQQVLKLNFANENLRQEKSCLTNEVYQLKQANQALSNDLCDKNMTIKHLRDEQGSMSSQFKKFDDKRQVKLNSIQQLESQVQDLQHQIVLLQRYRQSGPKAGAKNEVATIKDSIHSLRVSMPPHDSRQQILDTLTQAVRSITEQSPLTPEKSHQLKAEYATSPPVMYSPKSRRKRGTPAKTNSTTIMYFSESNMTPTRATTSKKIGDITLKDIKSILHVSDDYRFNFKALDPEFGTVKKEVFHNNEIVPGWEGKIVVWVERKPTNGHQ